MIRNRSIDAVRAIACAFVLFVHCPFPGAFGIIVSALARFAVPFYLMVSGYYACRETDTAMLPLLFTGVALNEFMAAPWYYTGNWLLTGLPFFLLGHYIAAKKPRIAHPEWFILPGALLLCLETRLNTEIYVSLGSLLLSVSIFLTCLARPEAHVPKALARFGRSGSVILFIIHCAVRDFAKLLIPQSLPLYAWALPLMVLALSIALSKSARPASLHLL